MNVYANFDILYFLSHPRNTYFEQTAFEINAMLYLAELLSIYDGNNSTAWEYSFARNKYGAPMSVELLKELELLTSKGFLIVDDAGYYRISDEVDVSYIDRLSRSSMLGWRTRFIDTVLDSLLTKSLPRVIAAIQKEPGIALLENIDRTSSLLDPGQIEELYNDFGALKAVINNPEIDLIVPASLWIDYLTVQ